MAKIAEVTAPRVTTISEAERVIQELVAKLNELIRAHNATQ